MKNRFFAILTCTAALSLPATVQGEETCPADADNLLCGTVNAEDLVWLPDGSHLVASSLAGRDGAGYLSLIDPASGDIRKIYPAESASTDHKGDWFGACETPPDATSFSPHGLSVLALEENLYRLYVVAHGARESVEVFELDTSGDTPLATWTGCVEFPATDSINSVAALPDGGFYATRIASPTQGYKLPGDTEGPVTGFLYHWQPGNGPSPVPGTEMSYPNGVVVSPDGDTVYVASWGRQKIVRFRTGDSWTRDGEGTLGFRPDNLRWSDDDRILTGGQRMDYEGECGQMFCFTSWSAASIDPVSLEATSIAEGVPAAGFLAATVAVSAPGGYLLGTFVGDRLIFVPEGWRASQ